MVDRLIARSGLRRIAVSRRSGGVLGGLAWDTAWTVVLNVSGMLFQLALALALTHMLGVDGYGAYALALAWGLVLASPAMMGLTPLVVRNVAAYSTSSSWHLTRGLIRRSHQVVAMSSCAIAGTAALVGWLVAGDAPTFVPFLLALPLVPLVSLTAMRQAAMQGLGHVILGRTPEVVVLPALALLFVGVGYVGLGDDLSSSWAVALNVAAAAVSFALGGILLRRVLSGRGVRGARAYDMRSWATSALPFLVSSVAIAVNSYAGTILVGAFSTNAEAGIFNAALRIALLVGFLSLAATYSVQPLAARLFARGEIDELERVLARAGRLLFVASAVVSIVLVVLAKPVLGLFGPEFEAGAPALRILALGELVRLAMGYPNLALVMTRHERPAMTAFCIGTGVNVALAVALIPAWGAEGAAMGLATGKAVWTALASIFVWRHLRIVVAAVLPTVRSR